MKFYVECVGSVFMQCAMKLIMTSLIMRFYVNFPWEIAVTAGDVITLDGRRKVAFKYWEFLLKSWSDWIWILIKVVDYKGSNSYTMSVRRWSFSVAFKLEDYLPLDVQLRPAEEEEGEEKGRLSCNQLADPVRFSWCERPSLSCEKTHAKKNIVPSPK